jgi:hypothetical protein
VVSNIQELKLNAVYQHATKHDHDNIELVVFNHVLYIQRVGCYKLRPPLSWTFISAGARLCQTLRHHRMAVLARDLPKLAEEKYHAFWALHIMDKNFVPQS